MGGHHKKNLRAEKAKVKLKGVKLPKGLNVTKTDFKVRKITIREQLKESQYADGQKLVNLKETLSRLKHHSSSYRLEALRNLKESIAAGDEKILAHLNELTQGIAAICLDIDKETRRECNKVLSCFLGALTEDSVAPFFHVISSYLRCAMTHIQPAIQEDSLLMLDVLLQHVPHLVAASSGKIFQNFLEMISKVRAEGDKAGRMLTVQMGNKQTTIKWRSKILQRLQQMLQVLAYHNARRLAGGGGGVQPSAAQLTHSYNQKQSQHFALKRSFGARSCDLAAIFCKSIGDASHSAALGGGVGSTADERQLLQRYIEHLMPLLIESWLEVRPQQSATAAAASHAIICHDAALTLQLVLEIIAQLWALVQLHEREVNSTELSEWFRAEYAESFATNFMQRSFPYQQTQQNAKDLQSKQKGKKATLSPAGGQFCLQQNVNLCHLMSVFFAQNITAQPTHFTPLLHYMTTLLDQLSAYQQESLTHLEQSLRALLYTNGQQLLQLDAAQARLLLKRTIKALLDAQLPAKEGVAAKVLVLLCDIVQQPALYEAYGATQFQPLLVYMPTLLLRPSIAEQALVSMSQLCKQRNVVFGEALQQLVLPIIENIQKIQVQGACNAFEGKKHIMNLFYGRDLTQQSELQQSVQTHVTDKRISSYFQFILGKC